MIVVMPLLAVIVLAGAMVMAGVIVASGLRDGCFALDDGAADRRFVGLFPVELDPHPATCSNLGLQNAGHSLQSIAKGAGAPLMHRADVEYGMAVALTYLRARAGRDLANTG